MTYWGGYIIVLQWIINWLWDVNWVVMKLGCWRMSDQLWNVDCDCWLTLANGIQNEWPGCDCWLASANDIWDGWPGCDCWLASANDIWDGWSGCAWWLASANGIRDGWPGYRSILLAFNQKGLVSACNVGLGYWLWRKRIFIGLKGV